MDTSSGSSSAVSRGPQTLSGSGPSWFSSVGPSPVTMSTHCSPSPQDCMVDLEGGTLNAGACGSCFISASSRKPCFLVHPAPQHLSPHSTIWWGTGGVRLTSARTPGHPHIPHSEGECGPCDTKQVAAHRKSALLQDTAWNWPCPDSNWFLGRLHPNPIPKFLKHPCGRFTLVT